VVECFNPVEAAGLRDRDGCPGDPTDDDWIVEVVDVGEAVGVVDE
jgi:hypothetical protein